MIRPYYPSDLWQVLPYIRQEELDEVRALGEDPRECLETAIYSGETITVVIDGEICGIAGVMESDGFYQPWSVFTDKVAKFPITFLRDCLEWVNRYNLLPLWNVVLDRNEKTKAWLLWLGFNLGPPFDFNGHQFRTYWGGTWVGQ